MFNTWGPKKIERGQKQKLQYQFFFETDTDTFIGTKFFRNWYWYFFRYQRFFKPIPILFPIPKYFETDTIKNGKVSKLRSFETEMSHSANNQNNHWNTEWQLQSYLTCFQYEQPGQVFLLQLITPLPPARIVTVSIIHVIFVVVHNIKLCFHLHHKTWSKDIASCWWLFKSLPAAAWIQISK